MLRSNLNEILVFMAVVDEGSFVAGGRAMGLTRSAAGKAVSRLEDRLGVRLLNRTTRTLSLTDEGRLFYDRGVQILAAIDDAESSKAVLCASPSYIAAHGEPLDVDSLAGHDCLIFSSRNRRQSWLVRDGEGAWVQAQGRSRLRLDSGEALRDAAVSGLGIAFLPDFLVAGDLAAGRLQQVLPALEFGDVNIVTIYPTKRLLEPRVRRFIDLMVEELGR